MLGEHFPFDPPPSSRRSEPPSSRRLPVAALESPSGPRDGRIVLHVFCPRDVAARPLEGCRDCPSCIAFDAGEEDGARPAVVCGY